MGKEGGERGEGKEKMGERVRGEREWGEKEGERKERRNCISDLQYTTQTTWLSTVTVSTVTVTREMVVVGY